MELLSPFHSGEQSVQTSTGVRDAIEKDGRIIVRNYMPDQHLQFFLSQGALPTLFVCTIDENGRPWASILIGNQFVKSPNNQRLEIRTRVIDDDPLTKNLKNGSPIGLVGIEFATRRRNRMNGKIEMLPDGFAVNLDQSFGNCPKYIQARKWSWKKDELDAFLTKPHSKPLVHSQFTEEVKNIIKKADTLFIASAYLGSSTDDQNSRPSSFGCDISHRGGRPGFVSIIDNNTITWPDYIGNFLFNTIGNLIKYPKSGLLFLDFEKGDIIQMSGEAKVSFEEKILPGAQRTIFFQAHQVLHFKAIVPMNWEFLNYSPFNPKLVDDGSKLNMGLDSLSMACVAIHQESYNVKTYVFGGGIVLTFKPGQYVTFEIDVDGKTYTRNWTISSAPESLNYRIAITVKKKNNGVISNWLFDNMTTGVQFRCMGISGEFSLEAAKDRKKILFIVAGIGITPGISIIRWIVKNAASQWDVTVVWSVSTVNDILFKEELKTFPSNVKFVITVSRSSSEEWNGATGRITKDLIVSQVPDLLERVTYLCGPELFMEDMQKMLHDLEFPADRLITEAFNF